MLDEPYKLITDKGNHSLKYSNENESLIDALKKTGYVNRFIVHEKIISRRKVKIHDNFYNKIIKQLIWLFYIFDEIATISLRFNSSSPILKAVNQSINSITSSLLSKISTLDT